MIAYLKGAVQALAASYVIVNVGNVGYKVFTLPPLIVKLKIRDPVAFFVHTYVREDQLSLYGFLSAEDLDLFELLISVSGVGPRMAISLMSSVATAHIRSAIAGGEAAVFTKVSGVGRKTAERIIIELKEKVGEVPGGSAAGRSSKEYSESLDALVALGYNLREAREALKQVSAEVVSSSAVIRAALKVLGNR